MSDSFSVRAATLADLDPVVDLFEQYRAFYHCDPDRGRASEFLRERLQRTDSAILVAEFSRLGRLAGFVQLYPTFSSLRMARALVLNDLYVAQEFRRAGVARALMTAAHAFARMSGAVALTLETARDNRTARALYESLGYRSDERFMQYSLEV